MLGVEFFELVLEIIRGPRGTPSDLSLPKILCVLLGFVINNSVQFLESRTACRLSSKQVPVFVFVYNKVAVVFHLPL